MIRAFFSILSAAVLLVSCCRDSDIRSARALARRVVPEYASSIRFEKIDTDGDRFELETVSGRLVIRGNNVNSMATGLGHYLKYVCKSNYSWFEDEPMTLPETMPAVPEKIELASQVTHRFFLNYCTYGHTTPYWTWKEWGHLVDWMALNGVNLALAPLGQEAVWMEVFQDLGMTKEQVLGYFCSPATLPWQWMNNGDYLGSPLPEEWIAPQAELQKKILERMRSLGIKPVLQAYNGHFQKELQDLYPDADYSKKYMCDWGDWPCRNRSYFLDPSDSLFLRIQKLYLEKQEKLYGTDHYYCIDLFNEMWAPSFEPEYLGRVSRQVYESLAAVDPDAVWVQMGWMMFFIANWTNEGIDAFVNGAPKGRMLFQDYYAERVEIYKHTQDFYGQDFLWCYLGNFGGNCDINANFKVVDERLDEIIARSPSNFKGVGLTLEALGTNPFMDEYVLERAWRDIDPDYYWTNLADRYLGREDENWREAWRLLRQVYETASAEKNTGSAIGHIPIRRNGQWEGNRDVYVTDKGWWNNTYDKAVLEKAWEIMKTVEPSSTDSYRYWMTNVGRQVLSDRFNEQYDLVIDAINDCDLQALKDIRSKMLEIGTQLDSLLAGHQYFSLDKWMKMASDWGKTPQLKYYYEVDARIVLTFYSEFNPDYTNDYEEKQWHGLVGRYYLPRWDLCLSGMIDSLEQSGKIDFDAVYDSVMEFERRFVYGK